MITPRGSDYHLIPRSALRLMLTVAITLFLGGSMCNPRTYACPNNGQHCYGYVEFNVVDLGNGPSFRAFITNVYARGLLGGDGEITDEIWVNQYPTTACGDGGI